MICSVKKYTRLRAKRYDNGQFVACSMMYRVKLELLNKLNHTVFFRYFEKCYK